MDTFLGKMPEQKWYKRYLNSYASILEFESAILKSFHK